MSGVAFLLLVVVVSGIGSLVVWLRHRQPTHFMSGVEEFRREMSALDGVPPPSARPSRPVVRPVPVDQPVEDIWAPDPETVAPAHEPGYEAGFENGVAEGDGSRIDDRGYPEH